jgi:hypothetical protein
MPRTYGDPRGRGVSHERGTPVVMLLLHEKVQAQKNRLEHLGLKREFRVQYVGLNLSI